MPKVHVHMSLLPPPIGLALVAIYATGQTQTIRPRQNPPQPYTAEFKITTVRTLANGTTLTRESTETRAVDRDGRAMTMTKEAPLSADQAAVTRVHVQDPVEGMNSNWDSQQSKATIVKAPPADQHQGCWATESGRYHWRFGAGAQPRQATPVKNAAAIPPARPKPEVVDLGNTTIEGVEAHGTRTTYTIPAGEIGNDAPLLRTYESWWGTTFGLLLREVNDDPESGKRTREVVSLSLGDPDPALFQPPEGYEVKTETAHPVACE